MKYLELNLILAALVLLADVVSITNVAFNKTVTMSSLYADYTAGSRAVDGNKTGNWYADRCACTRSEQNPWMLVDLYTDHLISSLYLLNRQDSAQERLSNIHIETGLFKDNLTEILYHSDAVGADITFPFEPTECGRFVKIWLQKTTYLTICEIEVYGIKADGNWTEWSDWSSCSHSCGNGTASRSRSCNGSNCCGFAIERVDCNTHECSDAVSDNYCWYEPHDCQDIDSAWSGVYHVTPLGTYAGFDVFCDMVTDGGGWVVLHRREDASVEFLHDWREYLLGFGPKTGNYWLGLKRIKSLVAQGHYELRIDLVDTEGNQRYAVYKVFNLGENVDQYPLIVDGYFGDAGDALTNFLGIPFSTGDRNMTDAQCPGVIEGGWWFSDCSDPLLNGQYHEAGTQNKNSSMHWISSEGEVYSVLKSYMKIRRI